MKKWIVTLIEKEWIDWKTRKQKSHLTRTNVSFSSKFHLPLLAYFEKHFARHFVYRNTHTSWRSLLISGQHFKGELFQKPWLLTCFMDSLSVFCSSVAAIMSVATGRVDFWRENFEPFFLFSRLFLFSSFFFFFCIVILMSLITLQLFAVAITKRSMVLLGIICWDKNLHSALKSNLSKNFVKKSDIFLH